MWGVVFCNPGWAGRRAGGSACGTLASGGVLELPLCSGPFGDLWLPANAGVEVWDFRSDDGRPSVGQPRAEISGKPRLLPAHRCPGRPRCTMSTWLSHLALLPFPSFQKLETKHGCYCGLPQGAKRTLKLAPSGCQISTRFGILAHTLVPSLTFLAWAGF